MATNRDLLQAHAANRQRLVAAFVSGVGDGGGLDARGPWRPLVIGLILAGLLLAGAAAVPFVLEAM